LIANGNGISAVGALVIPTSKCSATFDLFARMRKSLPQENGEVKGRLLDETSIGSVVDLLYKNDALLEVTAVDMGLNHEADFVWHKSETEKGITALLSDQHHKNVHDGAWALRRKLECVKIPLYVQSILTFATIESVLQHAPLYFAQRIPAELGAFHWLVDGKEKSRITDWESWWSYAAMPSLEAKSQTNPMPILKGADYSHFKRFEFEDTGNLTAQSELLDRPTGIDLRKVMSESFRFSSDIDPGLELVDICVNAMRRALNGHLNASGWKCLKRIMVHRKSNYVRLVSFKRNQSTHVHAPCARVLNSFTSGGRAMIV
jgi:hypothetical protein